MVLLGVAAVVAVVVRGGDATTATTCRRDASRVEPLSASTPLVRDAAPERQSAVQVWVTTPDRSELLHRRDPVRFGTPADPGAPTVVVDPQQELQQMDGFGASMTDSSAEVLHRLDADARDAVVRELFDPVDGIGLSFLRQPIGSSDFTAAERHHSLDDAPPGSTDLALERFSIARDEQQVLPLLRRARELNPDLRVMGTPWSPPAWMKTSGSLVGGQLEDDPEVVDAYARYLVRFAQAYADAGVPVDYLSVQNEPQAREPDDYPAAVMPAAQQAEVIEALGPLLDEACPGVGILGFDHNWAVHRADAAAATGARPLEDDYPARLLEGPAGRWLAGTAFHAYAGDPSAMADLHEAFPDKGVWCTECSGSHTRGDAEEKVFADTLDWQARMLTIGSTRAWARSVVGWNIALDDRNGPHLGGCGTCTGLLTVHDDGSLTRTAEYYTLAHLSKFVVPGARRVASSSFGTTAGNGQVADAAFTNPDGSTALVVHNQGDGAAPFTVAVGESSFGYSLPAGALATFTWPASAAGGPGVVAVPLEGATATTEPRGEGSAAALVDDDSSTRWTSGSAQVPGQHVDVDLGGPRRFSRVALDSGGWTGDGAASFAVSVSDDGERWRQVAEGASAGQLTSVDVGEVRARHLRVASTGSSRHWWSLVDLRLYRAN